MTFSADTVKKAWDRQGGRCAVCNKKLVWSNRTKGKRGSWQPHHRKPRKDGGTDTLGNCVLLCTNCHLKVGHGGNFQLRRQLSDKAYDRMYEGNDPYHQWYNEQFHIKPLI